MNCPVCNESDSSKDRIIECKKCGSAYHSGKGIKKYKDIEKKQKNEVKVSGDFLVVERARPLSKGISYCNYTTGEINASLGGEGLRIAHMIEPVTCEDREREGREFFTGQIIYDPDLDENLVYNGEKWVGHRKDWTKKIV